MEEAAAWVRRALGKGSYVRCVEVGNGIVDSWSRSMGWQLEQLAEQLQADRRLAKGFHMIGHSQGALLARGYVQRYNAPRVHTLVSWVGPQAGQFGVPDWEANWPNAPAQAMKVINQVTSSMWCARAARPPPAAYLSQCSPPSPQVHAAHAGARLLLQLLARPAAPAAVPREIHVPRRPEQRARRREWPPRAQPHVRQAAALAQGVRARDLVRRHHHRAARVVVVWVLRAQLDRADRAAPGARDRPRPARRPLAQTAAAPPRSARRCTPPT